MDYQTLKTLIDSEPLNAGRSDQEVLDWLNEPSGQFRNVPLTDIYRIIMLNGIDVELEDIESGETTTGVTRPERQIARQFKRVFSQTLVSDLNVFEAPLQAILNALVASPRVPAMTAAVKADIDALGVEPTRMGYAGFVQNSRPSWLHHIANARAL